MNESEKDMSVNLLVTAAMLLRPRAKNHPMVGRLDTAEMARATTLPTAD